MYEAFYGFNQRPFSLTPDPQFLYWSEGHRTVIESILYGIHRREGFMVITGDIGTGKTTLCRALMQKLNPQVKTAVIFNSFVTEAGLLSSILEDFGSPAKGRTKKERIDALNRFLVDLLSRGENAVVIVDEAQNLSVPVLEQIRMLSNLETEKEKMLQIVLLGQLELEKKLQSPKLKQLSQRIAIRCHLHPLSREETKVYIDQRLSVAGDQRNVTFSKVALDEIHKFSKGIPRLINLICDRALLAGFVDQTGHIDKCLIRKGRRSLMGIEGKTTFSRFLPWPKRLAPWTVSALFFLFLFCAGMIHLGQSDTLLRSMIQGIGSRIQNVRMEVVAADHPDVYSRR
jgi:general secretion pathway protein A